MDLSLQVRRHTITHVGRKTSLSEVSNPQYPVRSQSTKDYYAIMGKGYARRYLWQYNKPMVKRLRAGKQAEWESYLIDLDAINRELERGATGSERDALLRRKSEYERMLNRRQNPVDRDSWWGFFDPRNSKYILPRPYDRIHHDLAQRLGYVDAHDAVKSGLVRFSVDKDEAVVQVRDLNSQGWAAVEVLRKMKSSWKGPVTKEVLVVGAGPALDAYSSLDAAIGAVSGREVNPSSNPGGLDFAADLVSSFMLPGVRQAADVYARNPDRREY